MTTATTIYFKQILRYGGIPFEVRINEPNNITYKAIEEAEKGENVNGPFDTTTDLIKSLNG